MVNRLTVTLEQPEYTALLEIADKELRDPQDQVRFILRQELERRGLLTTAPAAVKNNTTEADHDAAH